MKVRRYPSLRYTTLFNSKTGFFARIEDKGHPEPFWAPFGPELLDISITSFCDRLCKICYRQADGAGKHMPLENYQRLIDIASSVGVYQVALGGGNPNQHPDFTQILKYTRSNGIVPNYTTNGRGLTSSILKSSKEHCGAVAVSAYAPFTETASAIKALVDEGIKVNVHYILTAESIKTAIEWLKHPPRMLKNINALIFLNYKPVGRSVAPELLLRNNELLGDFFEVVTSVNHPFKIGFDSCSISGVMSYTEANINTVEACDAGRFSMFISEDMTAYPCSFYIDFGHGVSITDENSFLQAWKNSHNFENIRNYFNSSHCSCDIRSRCLNGCPIFPELKICRQGEFKLQVHHVKFDKRLHEVSGS